MSIPAGKQQCFLCQGDGKVYPFANKGGIGKECPACKGSRVIEDYYVKCPHCDGTAKVYDNNNKVFPKDCKLCEKKRIY